MVLIPVECPSCQSIEVSRYGKQPNGEQRYQYHNADCPRTIFLLHYHDKGCLPGPVHMKVVTFGKKFLPTFLVMK